MNYIKIAISWLKSNYKLSLILLASVSIVLFLWLNQIKINNLRSENSLQKVELSSLNDSVNVYKGKNGNLTFKLESVEVESSDRKKALELAQFDIKDLKARDIKWRDVNFALNAKLEAITNGTTDLKDTVWLPSTTNKDSVKAFNFNWQNNFHSIKGTIVGKKMNIDYLKYKVGFSIINTPVKNTNVVSVYLTDPDAIITTSNSITVKPKTKWGGWKYLEFGAGLVTGYFIFK